MDRFPIFDNSETKRPPTTCEDLEKDFRLPASSFVSDAESLPDNPELYRFASVTKKEYSLIKKDPLLRCDTVAYAGILWKVESFEGCLVHIEPQTDLGASAGEVAVIEKEDLLSKEPNLVKQARFPSAMLFLKALRKQWIESNDVVEILMSGTSFQKSVWRSLSRIPRRVVVPYSAVAKLAGNERAVRAAASSVGCNPLAPILPCHRVVRLNRSLGGYAFGVEMKLRLLRYENG